MPWGRISVELLPALRSISGINPGTVHHFQHFGSYNSSGNKYSYPLIVIDGTPYPIPVKLQNLTATHPGWPDGFYPQFQQDVRYKPGTDLGMCGKVVNMNIVVW